MAKKKARKGTKKDSTVSLERFFESVGPQREKTVIEHAQEIIKTAAANGRDMLRLREKVNLDEAPKRTKKTARKGKGSDKGIEKLFDDFSAGLKAGGGARKGKGKRLPKEVREMNKAMRGYKKAKAESDEFMESSKYN